MSTLSLFPGVAVEGQIDSDDAQNTPADLCVALGSFDMDVASNPRSRIQAAKHVMLENGEDGLAIEWRGSIWCNGPYSDPLPWCERLARHGGPWCSLWKLDTTTQWFRELMRSCDAWAAFRKRLTFERPGNCGVANFSSVLAWGGGWKPPADVLSMMWTPCEMRARTVAVVNQFAGV